MGDRNSSLKLRAVEAADGEKIGEFLSQTPMPGPIGLSCKYSSPFWDAFAVEGHAPKGVVVLSGETLVGVGLISIKKLWIGGKVTKVGYLNSLRLAPEVRNGFTTARGFNLLRNIHQQELGLPLYLTSIIRGNDIASKTLLGGRAGLPEYRRLSPYKTCVFPLWKKKWSAGKKEIRQGSDAGLDTVTHCLETFGKQIDLFPVITGEDIIGGRGPFRDLDLDNFLVAYNAGDPVGIAAVWDQSPFKNYCVSAYSGYMKPMEKMSNVMAKATGCCFVPNIGSPFSPAYLSCLAINDNDPLVFKGLLKSAMVLARQMKKNWLVVGFFADDPLISLLRREIKFSFDSDIYTVHWDDGATEAIKPGTKKYLDVGSL